jgi:biotin transport system substrate-specific component
MTYLFNSHTQLESIFCSRENSLSKQALLILFGVLLLAIVSQLSVPLRPVPLTFQSTTVILIGMAYGARQGSYVVMSYLLAGICGLPVFAHFSSGITEFYGPTSGYLLGFLPAAWFSGYLAQKGFGKNVVSSFVAALLGDCIIFALGLICLAAAIGIQSAIAVGLLPFLLSEPIKLIAVAYCIPRCFKKSS